TLSNTTDGLDDPVALNPENFKTMCQEVRNYEKYPADQILQELKNRFGSEKIELILGDGIKKLAPSERMNYSRTNRCLRFLVDKTVGETINETDIGILRTEKVLDVGLEPKFLNEFIGRKLTRDVKSSDPVLWNCITN
ncbi:MAG: spore coat protein, partial [Treponemataceae bacterium]|nr:spore coat protein [Treponemataceae bacterium]